MTAISIGATTFVHEPQATMPLEVPSTAICLCGTPLQVEANQWGCLHCGRTFCRDCGGPIARSSGCDMCTVCGSGMCG